MRLTLFSVSIISANLPNQKIKKRFLSLLKKEKQNNNSRIISNIGGFQTQSLTDKILGEFLMNSSANLLTSHYQFKKPVKFILNNFWINENYKNSYNKIHRHQGQDVDFSGIYYLQVPKKSGNIYFESNDPSREMFNIFYPYIERHTDFERHIEFEPKDNNFVIFPSNLNHGVEPNESNSKRISVAFNFMIRNV